MKNKLSTTMLLITILVSVSAFLLGFTHPDKKIPVEAYNVYLDGEKIGVIESKEDFESYINQMENSIKILYDVENVYAPKGVEIKKVTTYSDLLNTNEEIYQKIVAAKKFTVHGVVVTINYEATEEETKEPLTINVLNKEMFDEALSNLVKAFVDTEEYEAYMASEQEEIVTTGRLIENIDVQEKITYKDDLISVGEKIFTDVDELTKFLLYGTLEQQDTYIVQEGDTIEEVAINNKLNVQEFLIANPQFTSANNLLYESQEVVVGLIDPVVSIVVEYHSVEEEEKPYEVEIQYDSNMYTGYESVEREGENGLYRVTRKYQYINGQLADSATISSTELQPAVNEILVKGDKYVPNVADLSYWAWPTNRPYVITTYYEYRWGEFHDALDISGPGYGSAIYAANNGTVYSVRAGCTAGVLSCNGRQGNVVIINHNIGGYYTIYMHMKDIYVTEGQTVARGQQIGTMGNTGNVYPVPSASNPYAGTHLHFGVYIGTPYSGGYTINPYNLY